MSKALLNSVLVFIAGSSYGFIVPVIKIAAENGIFPASFLPLQYLFALVICLIAVLVTKAVRPAPKCLLKMMVLGFFTGATSICYYSSVTLLPSAAALTLLFQYVWVSVLIDCIHKRKLPSASSVIAVIVVLIGTLFATGLLDGNVSALDPLGVVYGAASAVFYALFLYFSGIIGAEYPLVVRSTMLALGGLIITSLANPAVYTTALFDPRIWPYAAGLAFLGILFPTTLINFASPKLSAGMVSIMASSELPVGILAAWAIAQDTPSGFVLFGAVLVLLGIVCKQIPDLMKLVRR